MLDMEKYRKAIEAAAWDTQVMCVSIDKMYLNEVAQDPMLYISLDDPDQKSVIEKKFVSKLNSYLDPNEWFMALARPEDFVNTRGVRLVYGGSWCYNNSRQAS